MTRIPIRVRVAAAFALAMAVVLAGSGAFVYARLGSHLDSSLAQDLRLRTQDLAALVRHGGSLTAASGGRLVERGESYAQLLDSRGRVLQWTQPIGRAPLLTTEQVRRALTRETSVDKPTVPGLDEASRLLATPLRIGGKTEVLAVGATLGNNQETQASLRDLLLIVGPTALALASLAGYFLAGLSLRPVEWMRRRAAAISGESIERRLPVPRTHDEIERLAETLNEMLGRIEEVLSREREFVADAGHELRTPLALLRTELELALRHGGSPEELREAIRLASQEVDRLAQLAEGLLLIARTDRGRLPLNLESIDVGSLLGEVAARFGWRAEEAGRPIVIEAAGGLRVQADRLRVEQALGNLVDNALRHGAGRVELSAAATDGAVELHVRDDGSGFPPGFAEQAFDRFARLDRGRSGSGSGLGLSIAKTVAEAHGGSAHIANRPGGGSDVWVVIPSASAKANWGVF
ncbi:MAG: HAMP domain-containing protein [Actinobacteria bacterium]|nr:HAMP domain-containing protein [Actinomycetota bacterium]